MLLKEGPTIEAPNLLTADRGNLEDVLERAPGNAALLYSHSFDNHFLLLPVGGKYAVVEIRGELDRVEGTEKGYLFHLKDGTRVEVGINLKEGIITTKVNDRPLNALKVESERVRIATYSQGKAYKGIVAPLRELLDKGQLLEIFSIPPSPKVKP